MGANNFITNLTEGHISLINLNVEEITWRNFIYPLSD